MALVYMTVYGDRKFIFKGEKLLIFVSAMYFELLDSKYF